MYIVVFDFDAKTKYNEILVEQIKNRAMNPRKLTFIVILGIVILITLFCVLGYIQNEVVFSDNSRTICEQKKKNTSGWYYHVIDKDTELSNDQRESSDNCMMPKVDFARYFVIASYESEISRVSYFKRNNYSDNWYLGIVKTKRTKQSQGKVFYYVFKRKHTLKSVYWNKSWSGEKNGE